MTWIGSNRGRVIDFADPNPDQIDLDDLADGLSTAIRFRGLTTTPYTVAQHSVLASRLCKSHPLEALMHDAHEAYMCDVTRPLKLMLGTAWYSIEQRLQLAIEARFSMGSCSIPEVKRVDDILLATERRDLQPNGPEWTIKLPEPDSMSIVPWPIHQAKAVWLKRLNELLALRTKASA